MDNERKVNQPSDDQNPGAGSGGTDLIERSKQVFLREIVNEFRRRQQQYDVGTEFAKTKRNRSLLVPLTIIGLIVVFSGVVIAVTQYIQSNSRAIDVDIQDFADVNLREVLDEAQRLQNQLDAAQRELEQIESERDSRVQQAERARDRDIQLLQERELGAAARQQQTAAINASTNAQIERINAEYEPRIEELQARIAELREQIAQYDSRQLEQAREQEEVLDNQRRVFELEMEQLREEYETEIATLTERYEGQIAELEAYQAEFEQTIRQRHANEIARLIRRYNPDFTGTSIGPLLGAAVPPAARDFGGIGSYSAVLSQDGVVSRARFEELQRQYAAVGDLLDAMQNVPYENSVPSVLNQLELRTADLVAGFESIRAGLEDTVIGRDEIIAARDATIADQQERISEFLYALDEYARSNGDTGYILDPRDADNVVVYINRIRSVDVGTLGYVFRRDDEFVGTIRFVRRNGGIAAETVDTAEGLDLRAFDKVLIDVQ